MPGKPSGLAVSNKTLESFKAALQSTLKAFEPHFITAHCFYHQLCERLALSLFTITYCLFTIFNRPLADTFSLHSSLFTLHSIFADTFSLHFSLFTFHSFIYFSVRRDAVFAAAFA